MPQVPLRRPFHELELPTSPGFSQPQSFIFAADP
jgi:hypothetical protein